jgi:sugar lactone lactonase YvrE
MKKMKNCRLVAVVGLCFAVSLPLAGVETSFWQVGSFDDYLQGTLTGVSVSRDGELTLAPDTQAVFSPDENLALSLAGDGGHNLYVGTGHEGKVFRVDPRGKGALFFTAHEPDIFALAVGPDGALYVGSSPEGKVYRVTPDGKSSTFYDPKAKYIWALAFDANGRLYVGTGDQGKIFRVDRSGKGEVFFDSKQIHIMCLTFDRAGNLLAGSVPNGLIYRLAPEGKAYVLCQAGLPEIHALATDAQGRIYAAALGGSGGKGSPELFGPARPGTPVPGGVTTVTVVAGEESGQAPSKGTNPAAASVASNAPSFNRAQHPPAQVPPPKMPQGRGALIEILPDYSTETVWSSNNESIFGLAVRDNHVLFSTDANGRIFDLAKSRDGEKLTLLTETEESLATRLWLQGSNLYIATTNVARLFRLAAAPGREGTYESPVKDTKFISRWGVLAWRDETPEDSAIEFYTRSGNTDRPDQTWSEWSGPYRDHNGSQISSPPARYVQWKAVLRGSGAVTPSLDDVTVSYLNQNLPPEIRSLSVSTGGERTSPTGSSSTNMFGGTVTVTSAGAPGFVPSQPGAPAANKIPINFTWQADDPNGDPLVYSLYVKAADEEQWHQIKDKLVQNTFTIEQDSLADGRYVARLVASDGEANPPGMAREAELVSAPFWIDNTPPAVRVLEQKVTTEGLAIRFQAEDSTSPLRNAEVSTDGKDWKSVYSDDGVVDSRRETFTVKLNGLVSGEHIITLRAYDTAGNAGVGKAVARVP